MSPFIYPRGTTGAVTTEISRKLIRDRLGNVEYDEFLMYLMGPYKSFNLNYVLSEEERDSIDIDDLPGPIRKLFWYTDHTNRDLLSHEQV